MAQALVPAATALLRSPGADFWRQRGSEGTARCSCCETAGLVTGERLTVEEFLCRWEELPDLKNAELIDGVVYVSSPLSLEHGRLDTRIILWLANYAQATPGCESGNNSTWLM